MGKPCSEYSRKIRERVVFNPNIIIEECKVVIYGPSECGFVEFRSEVVSVDMKSCYTASKAGFCDARKHFKGFGHPGNRIVRVAVNGELPHKTGTGFCEVVRGSSRKVCTQ